MGSELSEKPEKVPEGNTNDSRTSTHDDSSICTASPPEARGEKSTAQSGVETSADLSRLDSKVIVAQKEGEDNPYSHLPEHEAEILRKRKCCLNSTTHSAR